MTTFERPTLRLQDGRRRSAQPATSRSRTARRVRAALAATVLLAPLGFSPAQAAPYVDVTYDLSQSSGSSTVNLPLVGPQVVPLPVGSIVGSQTLRYASDSASGIVPGAVSLLSFHLTVTAPVITSGGQTLATSTLHLQMTNVPLPGGSLLGGGTITPLGGVGMLRITGTQHCKALCPVVAVPRSSPTGIQPVTIAQPLPTLQTASSGYTMTGTTTATFTLDPGAPSTKTTELVPVTAVTFLVGREITRTPVPEPGTLPLLAAGLGGLGLAGAAWRLRRRG